MHVESCAADLNGNIKASGDGGMIDEKSSWYGGELRMNKKSIL